MFRMICSTASDQRHFPAGNKQQAEQPSEQLTRMTGMVLPAGMYRTA